MAVRGSRFLKIVPPHCAAAALTAGLALLAACDPLEVPIPEEVFEVNISQAQWQCAPGFTGEDPGSLSFNASPEQVGGSSYSVYALGTVVPANFSGDELIFSVTISPDPLIETFRMDWVFSQDRRSFHGKTTVDVNRSTDGGACLFTFVTDGKTVVIPVATIPPLPGQAARSASRSPAAIAEGFLCYGLPCFGLVGPQPTYGPLAQCFAVGSANYVQVLQPLQVLARNANPAVVELDWVGFRYRIHYGPDQLTALTYLTNSGAELGNADGFVYASPFYWAHVTDYPPLLNPAGVFLPGADALQYVRGDNARFRDVDGYYPIQNLPHGYYFVVYDIVWYTRNGINGYGLNPPEWGWLQIPVAPNGQFCVN